MVLTVIVIFDDELSPEESCCDCRLDSAPRSTYLSSIDGILFQLSLNKRVTDCSERISDYAMDEG